MHMLIEEGKKYRTRSGFTVGPMQRSSEVEEFPWKATKPDGNEGYWAIKGSWGADRESPLDLVEEVKDTKIRGWINIYSDSGAGAKPGAFLFSSKEAAILAGDRNRIATVYIEADRECPGTPGCKCGCH